MNNIILNDFDRTDYLERSMTRPRNIVGIFLTVLAFTLLVMGLMPLFLVLIYVMIQGANRLNWALFTELPPAALQSGGGIANALVGTIILVGMGALISVPIGILAAIYLSEFSSSRIARWIRFACNVLSGVPSIIIGIFAYGVIVLNTNSFSAYAGGFALAVLMLPIIVRATDEALQLVPQEIRWASVAVGASSFHTILQIVLPAALPAILTGVTLAVARAAGETAPLIFTALFTQFWPTQLLQPIPSLAVLIYNYATVPYQNQQELAWAASLILVLLILLSSIVSRWITGKSIY